ncbi:hypothetical protein SAMN05443575_2349 [Jatrophihabitans endophyticus]|uniref:DUF308 domain-containing protein n=1 Tax=Jatrophihabitans endophyticus TaxID=1206085 RepID=A0A1M5L4M1_9ACTN|nr:hypothetical protein [Jatrophihabitans endophyticus]SHG59900.1 hypothetical protein SAMN05443575_2349 [Jatrophihabitans endophyticus]
MSTASPEPPRHDNGLRAPAYVALTDVEPEVGQHLLDALGRARIAAYLADGLPPGHDRRRLFVASDERVDARTIVAAAVRALGDDTHPDVELPAVDGRSDPLAGIDTDSVFDALVADWHVDTHAAIRDAERDLNREDADWRARLVQPPVDEDPVWLDDDHYIPPPPPPLPRLAGPTILAMAVLAVSVVVLGLGGQFGVAGNLTFVLGIAGLLLGAGILLSRVRNSGRDEDDDGAAL